MREKVVSTMCTKRAYAIHDGNGNFYREPGTFRPFELFTSKFKADGFLSYLKDKWPNRNYEVKRVFVDVTF